MYGWSAIPPDVQMSIIGGGQNVGRTVSNAGLVRSLKLLGHWSGGPTSFAIPEAEAQRQAILVQAANGGPALAASSLESDGTDASGASPDR